MTSDPDATPTQVSLACLSGCVGADGPDTEGDWAPHIVKNYRASTSRCDRATSNALNRSTTVADVGLRGGIFRLIFLPKPSIWTPVLHGLALPGLTRTYLTA